MTRTVSQNAKYHTLAHRLHRETELTVWDGRFTDNPIRFRPTALSYHGFRMWMAQLDLEYPKDEEGLAVSSTQLSIEELGSHINFLDCLCAELEKV